MDTALMALITLGLCFAPAVGAGVAVIVLARPWLASREHRRRGILLLVAVALLAAATAFGQYLLDTMSSWCPRTCR
jgi:hypothetical protein